MRKAQPQFELAQLVANPVDLSVNAQAIKGWRSGMTSFQPKPT
jgi:hypothetical protein